MATQSGSEIASGVQRDRLAAIRLAAGLLGALVVFLGVLDVKNEIEEERENTRTQLTLVADAAAFYLSRTTDPEDLEFSSDNLAQRAVDIQQRVQQHNL